MVSNSDNFFPEIPYNNTNSKSTIALSNDRTHTLTTDVGGREMSNYSQFCLFQNQFAGTDSGSGFVPRLF